MNTYVMWGRKGVLSTWIGEMLVCGAVEWHQCIGRTCAALGRHRRSHNGRVGEDNVACVALDVRWDWCGEILT